MRYLLIVSFAFFIATPSFADGIYDRIDRCESAGGGACVFNLLRELAGRSNGGGGEIFTPTPGNYVSESYSMSIVVRGNSAEIVGSADISERGNYQCDVNGCAGSSYSFRVTGPRTIQMSYGRVWTLQ